MSQDSTRLFFKHPIFNERLVFFGKEINDSAFLEIKPNGNIYYKPAAFCECDKCKSYEGLKFLYNFLTGKKEEIKNTK